MTFVSRWPAVSAASIRLCYPFFFPARGRAWVLERLTAPLDALRLTTLAEAMPVPPDLRKRIATKQPLPVWEPFDQPVSDDLHPFVRRLFHCDDETDATRADGPFIGALAYQLTKPAQELLDGELGHPGPGLEIGLGRAAVKRLGVEAGSANKKETFWLPLRVAPSNRLTLHLFGSGVGLFVLELALDQQVLSAWGAEAVLETVYAAARVGEKQAPPLRWKSEGEALPNLSLETMIGHLLPFLTRDDDGKQDEIQPAIENRLFSYCCVRMDDDCDTELAEELVYRLSRRESTNYLPGEERIREGLYRPFDNIRHAMSIQGGAVLVENLPVDGRAVEFFANFIRDPIKRVYWPLALLAYTAYSHKL
jgi:hypothetical protein